MSDVLAVVRAALGRDLKEQEESLLAAIDKRISKLGGESADLLPTLLSSGDLLAIALDLDAAREFTSSVERIDVPSSNDCGTRSGLCSVRLPAGYAYYDHHIFERSANPHPGNIVVTVLPTGVDARWTVPFVGTFVGPWCGGAHSWLDADVVVRGIRTG